MAIKKAKLAVRDKLETEFLAVDLEIVSRSNLDPLIEALGKDFGINRNQKVGRLYFVLLSTGGSTPYRADPSKYISTLIRSVLKHVEQLPDLPRKLWDGAKSLTFDVGFQAGSLPNPYEVRLDKHAIAAASRLGACVQITIYGLPSA